MQINKFIQLYNRSKPFLLEIQDLINFVLNEIFSILFRKHYLEIFH